VRDRIIGVDPGSRYTGYGIIDAEGGNVSLVEAGCIRIPSGLLAKRLEFLFDEISNLCRQYHPAMAALETVFYARNARSALQLGQTRGVILIALLQNGCEVCEYSALQVKSAITGYGRAEKQQLQKMIQLMLRHDFTGQKYDVTDALALAIAHAQVSSFRNKLRLG
jgi:crossover junction endodeoxyribonuclease RuvC